MDVTKPFTTAKFYTIPKLLNTINSYYTTLQGNCKKRSSLLKQRITIFTIRHLPPIILMKPMNTEKCSR